VFGRLKDFRFMNGRSVCAEHLNGRTWSVKLRNGMDWKLLWTLIGEVLMTVRESEGRSE
jgi:hypothetical protein